MLIAELTARIMFGFSMNEPVVVLDQHCEYRLAPGEYTGGYRVNPHSMRSEAFPVNKSRGEFRVLVLGDSITEGDTSIPNEALATNRAEQALNDATTDNIRVRILNASTGSWSVANQMGFIDAFGDFDADAIVLVFNTADATDGFGSPLAPTTQPICGLHRALRLLRVKLATSARNTAVFNEPDGIFAKANAAALRRLTDHAESRGVPFVAIWHPTRQEIESGYGASKAQSMLDVFAERDIQVIRFADKVTPAIDAIGSGGPDPYDDQIHLTEAGHTMLAEILQQTIAPWIGRDERERAPIAAPGPSDD